MRKAANVLLITTCFFMFVGFLFKFLHWPGGAISIVFGTLISLIAMLFYFIARYKNKSTVRITTYYVYFYFFIMALGAHFFVGNVSPDLLNAFVMIEHRSNKINEHLQQEADGLMSTNIPEDVFQFVEKTEELITLIDQTNQEMIEATGGLDVYGIPYGKDNQDIASSFYSYSLVGEQIELRLGALNKLGADILGNNSRYFMPENIDGFEAKYDPSIKTSWTQGMTNHLPMSSVITNFALLKTKLLQNQVLVLRSWK